MDHLHDLHPCDPRQDVVRERIRPQHPLHHEERIRRRALGEHPVTVHQRLVGACFLRRLPRQHRPEEVDGLQVATRPTDVGERDPLRAVVAHGEVRRERTRGSVDRGRRAGRREVMRPRRRTARDLHVDRRLAASKAVVRNELFADRLQRRRLGAHHADAQGVEAVRHARRMPVPRVEAPADDAHHLVNAVAEHEAAILHRDPRLFLRHVLPIQIDGRHRSHPIMRSIPAITGTKERPFPATRRACSSASSR